MNNYIIDKWISYGAFIGKVKKIENNYIILEHARMQPFSDDEMFCLNMNPEMPMPKFNKNEGERTIICLLDLSRYYIHILDKWELVREKMYKKYDKKN